jgi:hypothetical protein
MASMTMDKEIITFDTIGQAYIAENKAAEALTAAQVKFAAGRISADRLHKLTEAATATRRERQRVVSLFAGAVHTTSARSYEVAA